MGCSPSTLGPWEEVNVRKSPYTGGPASMEGLMPTREAQVLDVVRGARNGPKDSDRPLSLVANDKTVATVEKHPVSCGRFFGRFSICDGAGKPVCFVKERRGLSNVRCLTVFIYEPTLSAETGNRAVKDDAGHKVYRFAEIRMFRGPGFAAGSGTLAVYQAGGQLGDPIWRRERHFHEPVGTRRWTFTTTVSHIGTIDGVTPGPIVQVSQRDRRRASCASNDRQTVAVSKGVDVACLSALLFAVGEDCVGIYASRYAPRRKAQNPGKDPIYPYALVLGQDS